MLKIQKVRVGVCSVCLYHKRICDWYGVYLYFTTGYMLTYILKTLLMFLSEIWHGTEQSWIFDLFTQLLVWFVVNSPSNIWWFEFIFNWLVCWRKLMCPNGYCYTLFFLSFKVQCDLLFTQQVKHKCYTGIQWRIRNKQTG